MIQAKDSCLTSLNLLEAGVTVTSVPLSSALMHYLSFLIIFILADEAQSGEWFVCLSAPSWQKIDDDSAISSPVHVLKRSCFDFSSIK